MFLPACGESDPSSDLDLATAKLTGISNLETPTALTVGFNKGTSVTGSEGAKTIFQLFDVVHALNQSRGTKPAMELLVTIPERFEGSDFEEAGPIGEPMAIWKRDFLPVLSRKYGSDVVSKTVKTYAAPRSNYWIQDYYEILSAGSGAQSSLVRVDLLQPENRGSALGKFFDARGVKALPSPFAAGTQTYSSAHGGNIEAMPNGRLYTGAINPYSTIDIAQFGLSGDFTSSHLKTAAKKLAAWARSYDKDNTLRVSKSKIDADLFGLPTDLVDMIDEAVDLAHNELKHAAQLQAYFKTRTGIEPVRIDTSWLALGHVDEVFSYVPASNACGYTLLWGDPLEGMLLEMASGSALAHRMQPKLLEGFVSKAHLDSPAGSALASAIRANRTPTLRDLETALDFLVPDASFVEPELEGDTSDPEKSARNRVILHLLGGRAQRQGVEALKAAQGCSAPAVALPTAYSVGQSDVQLRGLFDSVGRLNLVVLRDHVLVRHESSDAVRQSADFKESAKRLLQVIPLRNVHEVDVPSDYQGGAIHCATQVLRQPSAR